MHTLVKRKRNDLDDEGGRKEISWYSIIHEREKHEIVRCLFYIYIPVRTALYDKRIIAVQLMTRREDRKESRKE